MELLTEIWKECETSTVSKLYQVHPDGTRTKICYILEDRFQAHKVRKETRIPGGRYKVTPRRAGRHYKRYSDRWGHRFTMWVRHVPDFEWIMIHIGNFIKDTDGCLLTGSGFYYEKKRGGYCLSQSTKAYFKLYDLFEDAIDRGEDVFITIDRSNSIYGTLA